ncbi:MAG: hypothetical protein M1834_004484 [Cirrosporium novae-zelandiae]|nr:MAG: hypothetical protein M1834_004484 [Cirrosporium novae-zelandiae]
MHFFAASIATVSALVVATQAAPFTTVSHMAGAQQVYIDTTSCNNSGSILPQIYGLGSSNGSNYVTPQRSSTNRFEFTLPLTYSGRLWLRDTAETGNANDGSDVQSVEFTFYENPTAAKPNKAYITKVEKQIDPITAVRFFSSPKGEYISGTNMTTLTSTDDQDALYTYFCHEYSG